MFFHTTGKQMGVEPLDRRHRLLPDIHPYLQGVFLQHPPSLGGCRPPLNHRNQLAHDFLYKARQTGASRQMDEDDFHNLALLAIDNSVCANGVWSVVWYGLTRPRKVPEGFNDRGGRGYDDFVPGEVTKTAPSGDETT